MFLIFFIILFCRPFFYRISVFFRILIIFLLPVFSLCNILLSEHFINETPRRLGKIFFQIFVQPLTGLIFFDNRLFHNSTYKWTKSVSGLHGPPVRSLYVPPQQYYSCPPRGLKMLCNRGIS